ncbi:MAG: sulfite exporter TauE/SafE family protein, partial [Porticoccaceae bacterium]|nr:sulfite exporter TauE/SafE family protein [Porticoccaceae bacterium]
APLLRGIAGLLLISMGLYLAGWWRGLTLLEKAGQRLWQYLQPLAQGLLPVRTARSAILLGLVWGWLPCGLVYTALAYAATAASPLTGIAQMAAFGLGTLPAVLVGGLSMAKYGRILQGKNFRRVFALSLVAYGLWTLVPVFMIHKHY